MNKKGQKSGVLGFALITIAFVIMITAFATIEPFKEFLDTARDSTALNCKGTPNFNQTAFDNDESSPLNKLTRRPTCFVTGISMVYFIFAILIGLITWLLRNWRKLSK